MEIKISVKTIGGAVHELTVDRDMQAGFADWHILWR
jgi:hypothetical protein